MPRNPDPRHDLDIGRDGDSPKIRLSPTTGIGLGQTSHGRSVTLQFGRAGAGVDVSVQPGAVLAVVDDHARAVGMDPNRWRTAILRAVRDWNPDLDWCPVQPHLLATALGASTHPILALAYQRGCAPVTDIPRWASPILRTGNPTEATRRLTGGDTTRRLTRSFASALVGDARVRFDPLALAVAAAGLINVDELANVLEAAATSERCGPNLGGEQIRTIRAGLRTYPESRRGALLVDVATQHDGATLASTMTRLAWIADRAPQPLPIRLDGLIELCDRLVPVIAPPQAPVATSAPPPMSAPVPRSAASRPGQAALVVAPTATATATRPAPTTVAPVPDRARASARQRAAAETPRLAPNGTGPRLTRWPIPVGLRQVAGHQRDGLTLCVPTSIRELAWWGRQLHNCLDSYASAAAHERSWLIGIRRDDEMIGCLEVCPRTRRLRQALGPRNRPLAARVYDTTTSALADLGVMTMTLR